MSNPKHKPYWEMNLEELREATKQFDKPLPETFFLEPTPEEKALHDRITAKIKARRRGRPRMGRGAKRINVTIERGLLKRTDKFVKQTGLNRAKAIARGLELLLRSAA